MYKPDIILSNVDFPEPEPPTMAIFFPGYAVNEKFLIRGSLNILYPKEMFFTSNLPVSFELAGVILLIDSLVLSSQNTSIGSCIVPIR